MFRRALAIGLIAVSGPALFAAGAEAKAYGPYTEESGEIRVLAGDTVEIVLSTREARCVQGGELTGLSDTPPAAGHCRSVFIALPMPEMATFKAKCPKDWRSGKVLSDTTHSLTEPANERRISLGTPAAGTYVYICNYGQYADGRWYVEPKSRQVLAGPFKIGKPELRVRRSANGSGVIRVKCDESAAKFGRIFYDNGPKYVVTVNGRRIAGTNGYLPMRRLPRGAKVTARCDYTPKLTVPGVAGSFPKEAASSKVFLRSRTTRATAR